MPVRCEGAVPTEHPTLFHVHLFTMPASIIARMTEQYFDMLWDCPQCDAQGLLGTTHRHCPSCGAAQDPTKRYFPTPGQEVEAKNHRYAGVDWVCAYCETPNSAAAAFCGNCGGPKDGTKKVALVSDRPPGDPTKTPLPAALPTRSSPTPLPLVARPQQTPLPGIPWLKLLLVLLLVAGSVLAYLFSSKHDETVQIVEKNWSRSIDVERFTALRASDWCDAMPTDAYLVSRTREQRSTRQIPDGQDCVTVRSDMGDGTFTQRQECSTRYRHEAVFDSKCSYRINRWQLARTDQLTGGTQLTPAWPTPLLANTLLGTNRLGTERLGARREAYRVKLQAAQGKDWTCDLSATTWSSLTEHQRVTLKVRGTGGADCASLAAPLPAVDLQAK